MPGVAASPHHKVKRRLNKVKPPLNKIKVRFNILNGETGDSIRDASKTAWVARRGG